MPKYHRNLFWRPIGNNIVIFMLSFSCYASVARPIIYQSPWLIILVKKVTILVFMKMVFNEDCWSSEEEEVVLLWLWFSFAHKRIFGFKWNGDWRLVFKSYEYDSLLLDLVLYIIISTFNNNIIYDGRMRTPPLYHYQLICKSRSRFLLWHSIGYRKQKK